MKARARDEADIASDQEEAARQEALYRARWLTRLPVRHRCYNCDSACGGLFCDADCQQDYEKRKSVETKQHPRWERGTLRIKERPNA